MTNTAQFHPAEEHARSLLGRLKAEESGEVQDWDGYRTTEKVLRFEGLAATVIAFSNDANRYQLAVLDISSPAWRITGPLRIGQPAAGVLRGLGVAAAPSSGEWRFASESDALVLIVRGGALSRIIYDCYTG